MRCTQGAGIEAVAIVLMHAYTFTEHEDAIARVARAVGFKQVLDESHNNFIRRCDTI